MADGKRGINYKSDKTQLKAKELIDACLADARMNYARLDRDKQDWLNLLNYRGGVDNTWVVWDRSNNAWVPRPYEGDEASLPDWVPRACTNIYATKIDGIVALLDQSSPTLEWRPVTDDDEDLAAASVMDDAMPALYDEIDFGTLRRQMHKYIALTDKVALHCYYDAEEGPEQLIPALQCPACGKQSMQLDVDDADGECPQCQQDIPANAWQTPPANPDGTPAGKLYPIGKIKARLHPCFEFTLPRSARCSDEEQVPWVLLHTRYAKEDALKAWPAAKDQIDKAGAGNTGGTGLQRQYADAMARLAAPSSLRPTALANTSGYPVGPVVYQLQHDPTEDFPEGLSCVMIADTIVECGPLPVRGDDDKPCKSILIRTWALAPGSAFNKPPADDLVPLQYWRNLIESLIALSLLHNAAPRTFIPTSVILEDQMTGKPGENIRFRSQIPGERPITESGHNPAEGLYKYLEILDDMFEKVSKLNAVLMGDRPKGDPTLGEVQILQERGMSAFKTPLDTLVEFEKRLAKLLLLIGRQSAWSPRFRAIKGENGQWEVDQFEFSTLKGHVDVFCEPTTAWPRSPLMINLKIKEAVGMGALLPAQDPELSAKVLSLLDLSELKPSVDVVRKQIARQLDRWKRAHTPDEIINDVAFVPQPWWGPPALQLHLMLKSQFLLTEEVEALAHTNTPVYQVMVMHVANLQMMLMQMTAPPPPPPGAKPAGKPEPKPPDGSAVDAAVQSGAISPTRGQPDPLNAAVQSGAITPAAQTQQVQAQNAVSIDDLLAQRVLTPVPREGAPTDV